MKKPIPININAKLKLAAMLLAIFTLSEAVMGDEAGKGSSGLLGWTKWLLGLDVTAAHVMSGGDVGAGAIWIAALDGSDARVLADDDAYESPVFTHDNQAVIAKRGDDVVRISLADRTVDVVGTVSGLLAVTAVDDRGDALIARATQAGPVLAEFRQGTVRDLEAGDKAYHDDIVRALLRSSKRFSDGLHLRVDVSAASRYDLDETFDVFVEQGDRSWNATNCHPDSCGQPSLSGDRSMIAFIRR